MTNNKDYATAEELRDVYLCCKESRNDRGSCISARELEYWAECSERSIDRHKETLRRGASKRNKASLEKAEDSLQCLRVELDAYHLAKNDELFELRLEKSLADRKAFAEQLASEPGCLFKIFGNFTQTKETNNIPG